MDPQIVSLYQSSTLWAVWKKPDDVPSFFWLTAALRRPTVKNGQLAWCRLRCFIHPASVQMGVDGKRFEDIFVALMSQWRPGTRARSYEFLRLNLQSA